MIAKIGTIQNGEAGAGAELEELSSSARQRSMKVIEFILLFRWVKRKIRWNRSVLDERKGV